MTNFTIVDYKTAIRTQYKTAIERDVSGILSDPTPAQLRDFYLRLFEKGLSEIDEEILKLFLEAKENSSLKKTLENCNIGKLKPIINFLEGGNTENRARIEMAAILVDFRHRPFGRFKKHHDEGDAAFIDNLRDTRFFNPQISGDLIDEVKIENLTDSEEIFDTKDPETILSEEPETIQDEEPEPTDNEQKNRILRYLGIAAIILVGLGLITYFNLSKKECIQWSGNHYEEVSCDLKIQGIGTFNSPEPYDERIINLRRIKVSDTTTFFRNEKAIIWYAKVGDSIQFFNTHGMHPETGRALKPITSYIINKYVRK
jgi:hypothetical protein